MLGLDLVSQQLVRYFEIHPILRAMESWHHKIAVHIRRNDGVWRSVEVMAITMEVRLESCQGDFKKPPSSQSETMAAAIDHMQLNGKERNVTSVALSLILTIDDGRILIDTAPTVCVLYTVF